MACVSVCETFVSLQGESARAGLACFFVRLAGCNLRCSYCDTACAWGRGTRMEVRELVRNAAASRAPLCEITGGEPLLQEGFPALAAGLRDGAGAEVLVETNGSRDISVVPRGVTTIMDIKCPGSGEAGSTDMANVARLRPGDEVKFVLSGRGDYDWALGVVRQYDLPARCAAVHFSPAAGRLGARRLAGWLTDDRPRVRLQVQLHRLLGVK